MKSEDGGAGLLLRPDAYYAGTLDGVYVLTHEGESAFSGRPVHHLIDRLAPYLDGRHTLAELTAELPNERREMVERLITALLRRGVVREIERAAAPESTPAAHRYEIAFAGYFRDRPDSAFRQYQNKVTLVLGAGRLRDAVAAAAARSGLDRVLVATTVGCPTDLKPARSLLDGVDLVLHASDRPMAERAELLDRLCGEADVPLAQALMLDGHAWIAGVGAGWASAWRRLQARRAGAAPRPSGVPPDELGTTAVAAQLVHGVFRSLTGSAAPGGGEVIRVDLSTLQSEACAFLPHPFVGSVSSAAGTAFGDRIAGLRGGVRLDRETLARRAVACAGDAAGVFAAPTEREFAQIPLHVCQIEVSDPVGLLDPLGPAVKVIGTGLDFAAARHQAVLKAFAAYASLMIDPRRLRTIDDQPFDSRIDPDATLHDLKSGRLAGLVPGYGVADGDVRLVDVMRVFPALGTPAVRYEPPPGVAAAYEWDEAVIQGMLAHGRRLTLGGLTASATPFPKVDLADAALDPRVDRYRSLLAAGGEPITVYDVTGPLGVPVMVCYLGLAPAGYGAGLSPMDALTGAFEQALLRHQARENGQPDYCPPPIRGIPEHLRETTTRALSGQAPLDGTELATRLARRGHHPIAIPLDHDPEVSAIMPYVAHVVIADD